MSVLFDRSVFEDTVMFSWKATKDLLTSQVVPYASSQLHTRYLKKLHIAVNSQKQVDVDGGELLHFIQTGVYVFLHLIETVLPQVHVIG